MVIPPRHLPLLHLSIKILITQVLTLFIANIRRLYTFLDLLLIHIWAFHNIINAINIFNSTFFLSHLFYVSEPFADIFSRNILRVFWIQWFFKNTNLTNCLIDNALAICLKWWSKYAILSFTVTIKTSICACLFWGMNLE